LAAHEGPHNTAFSTAEDDGQGVDDGTWAALKTAAMLLHLDGSTSR